MVGERRSFIAGTPKPKGAADFEAYASFYAEYTALTKTPPTPTLTCTSNDVMANDGDVDRDSHQQDAAEEEAARLLSQDLEPATETDSVTPENARSTDNSPTRAVRKTLPRRQSSFAQPRVNGAPRTPHRVRFDVELDQVDGTRPNDGLHSWIDEEDYMAEEESGRRLNDGQRAPLLTDIEAPSVTLATDDFNPEDHLESARPKSSLHSAFMNMANSIIGAGIIGQPYAFKQAGLLAGITLLVLLTITVDWTIRLIVTNSKLSGANSFQATMQHCFGKSGLIAISVAQWAFAFGGMVAFCVIIGDTIPHVLAALFPSLETMPVLWLLVNRRAIIVLFVLGISFPLSLYRDIALVRTGLTARYGMLTWHSSRRLAHWR